MNKMPKGFRRRVLMLYAPGTNTERETRWAFELAGGVVREALLRDLVSGKVRITDCDCFVVPGGFSAGDYPDTGVYVAEFLRDQFPLLIEAGIPIIGICNGMQILVRAGHFGPGLAMAQNDSGRFVSRPVQHLVTPSKSIWMRGLEGQVITFPAAHRYGKLVGPGLHNVVMTYYGESPNGGRVAAICDDTGLVLAVMDHPERQWDNPSALQILRNGLTV